MHQGHYGDSVGTCPMAWKLTPEIMGGGGGPGLLDACIETSWHTYDSQLRSTVWEGIPFPITAEWENRRQHEQGEGALHCRPPE